MTPLEAEAVFQILIDELAIRTGGPMPMAELATKRFPKAGIYFFFEPGEVRADGRPRIVRIGTHGLTASARSTLSGRLRQHRGASHGGGNHRGSIFRLLLGEALMARGDVARTISWGVGGHGATASDRFGLTRSAVKAQEAPVEQAVSAYVRDMSVLLLPVQQSVSIVNKEGISQLLEPHEARGFIESNVIGLLSSPEIAQRHPPSAQWLGSHSQRQKVRVSGLWNQNHIGQRFDLAFLDAMDGLLPL